jgi:hypothetical protein
MMLHSLQQQSQSVELAEISPTVQQTQVMPQPLGLSILHVRVCACVYVYLVNSFPQLILLLFHAAL